MKHDHLIDEIEGRSFDVLLMKRLLGYLRPYRWRVALAVALLLVMTPFELVSPFIVKVAIDEHIGKGNLSGLTYLAILAVAVALVLFLLKYFQTYLTHWVGQRAMLDLRLSIFNHIQKQPLAFFDSTPVGTLMTRVGSDVEVLHEMFSAGVVTIFGDIAVLTGIMVIMTLLNWRLALVTFTVMPILFSAALVFRGKVRRTFRAIRRKVAAMNTCLQETIGGMVIIQLFGRQRENRARYERLCSGYQEEYLKAVFYYAVFFPAVEIIGALGIALIILYGGGRILTGSLTVGALVAFIEYTGRFMRPVQDLSEKYNILQSAMAASERIFQLLDRPAQEDTPASPLTRYNLFPVQGQSVKHSNSSEISAAKQGKSVSISTGAPFAVEFRNVHFAYRAGEEVLRGISMRIKSGETAAIVGATGAGKTSIISLLSRLYEPAHGAIYLDGADIRNFSLLQLRRRIGVVLQDVFLFSGTVADNILLDRADVTAEAVIREILRDVGALDIFQRLPQGLDTPLRERAGILSTGQKQLIAFARALAYNPEVLILDEATSSMDTESEAVVQSAMKRLLSSRTAIIVAHRLSTIINADRILVMHKGAIREEGTHRQLLAKGGLYSLLYQIQFQYDD